MKCLKLVDCCDATVFVIDEQRLWPSSDRKGEWEAESAGVADAGCAGLDWNLTGCCKTSSVTSEPEVFHYYGKWVDSVVEAG